LEEKYGDRPAFAEPDEEGRIAYEHKYAKLENGDLLGITWNPRERIIIVQRVKKARTNMKGLCDFTERYSKTTTPPIYANFDPHGGGWGLCSPGKLRSVYVWFGGVDINSLLFILYLGCVVMSGVQVKRGERILKKSPDFVERMAVAAAVSFSGDGSVFILDFLKPSLDLVADEKGKIIGLRGELEQSVRIFLSPVVCKKLLQSLSSTIENYEKQFGEIKVREAEES